MITYAIPCGRQTSQGKRCSDGCLCAGCDEVQRLRRLLSTSEATNRTLIVGGKAIQRAFDAINDQLQNRLQRVVAAQQRDGSERRACPNPI